MAQGVLIGRYDGVDVVERSESVNDFLGCFDGIIGERTFVESCWSLVFVYVPLLCMHGRRGPFLANLFWPGRVLLVLGWLLALLLTVVKRKDPSIPIIHKLQCF